MDKELMAKSVTETIAKIDTAVITTDDEAIAANDLLQAVKETKRLVDEYYEPERKARYDAYQAVLTEKKPYIEILEQAEIRLKAKLKEYKQQREREEQQRRAIAAASIDPDLALQELEKPVKIDGVKTRKIWRVKIDTKQLCLAVVTGLLPETVVTPNMVEINKLEKVNKNGLEWYQDEIVI